MAHEAALVARARAGDADAWEALVGGYQAPVFRLAYLILGDAADAEDVAQEAFVRAYLALARFDAARPLRPWLLSITANLARNRRRSLGRYWAAMQRAFLAEPRRHHAPPERTPASDARRLRDAPRIASGAAPSPMRRRAPSGPLRRMTPRVRTVRS